MERATRHLTASTSQNAAALIEMIERVGTDVRLCATLRDGGGFDPDHDGPDVNLPLLSAIAHDGARWVVFDGNFLSATRSPRRSEVEQVLDAAIGKGDVRFAVRSVDFTSQLSPASAADYLSSVETIVSAAPTPHLRHSA